MSSEVDENKVRILLRKYGHEMNNCLGKGAFGCVYLALETNLDEWRAVKAMKHDGDKSKLESVGSEIGVMMKFGQLPGFVKLYDFHLEDEYILLIMEHCREGNLETFKKKKRSFKLEEIQIYTYQLVRALYAMHNKKYIHRDLKPANILINREFDLLLSDFGICYKLNGGKYVDPNELGYTPYYTAPEVREQKRQTSACDIWGIGVIIAYMCFDQLRLHVILNDPDLEFIGRELCKIEEYKNEEFLRFLLPLFTSMDNRPNILDLLNDPFIKNNKFRSIRDYQIKQGSYQLPKATVVPSVTATDSNDSGQGGNIIAELLLYAQAMAAIQMLNQLNSGDESNSRSATNPSVNVSNSKLQQTSRQSGPNRTNTSSNSNQIQVRQKDTKITVKSDPVKNDVSQHKCAAAYLLIVWVISYLVPIAFVVLTAVPLGEIYIITYGIELFILIYRIITFTWQLSSLIMSFKMGCVTTKCSKSVSLKVKSCVFIFFIIILPIIFNIGSAGYLIMVNLDNIELQSHLMFVLLCFSGSDVLFWLLVLLLKMFYCCCD